MTSLNREHKTERDIGIDVARGIAMLLVIHGHALEIYVHQNHAVAQSLFGPWRFIYSFHVPLFFLISGMVFRKKSAAEHLASALKLVFIAWAVHVVISVLNIAVTGRAPTVLSFLKPFVFFNGFQGVVVWFLPALALVELAFHALLAGRGIWRWGLAGLIFCAFIAMQILNKTVWQISCLFPALIFYGIGYALVQTGEGRHGFSSSGWASISALLAVWVLAPLNHGCATSFSQACFNSRHGFVVLVAGGKYGNPVLFFVTALLGSAGIVWLSEWIARKGGRLCDGLRWIGSRTLDLLMINALFFGLALPLLVKHAGASEDNAALATMVVLGTVALQVSLLPLLQPATRWLTQKAALLATRLGRRLIPARMP